MTAELVDPTLELALKLGSGFCWTLAYILIIRRGWKDKSYGMPVVALGANLAWEFLFSWILPHKSPQLEVNRIWLMFDLVILWQAIRYGSAEQRHPWLRKNFYPLLACAVVGGFLAVNGITREFNDFDGMYAAFGQNLMMSILFCAMLLNRNEMRGQSMWIAMAKMVGTILPSILFYLKYPHSSLLLFLFVGTLLADIVYAAMLHGKIRSQGASPWKRF
ncbi:MAG: hypothetical protein IPK50_17630 [Fibrobacterota bacterium]|nr:hypothetical protein [Fibrobacterota bacterium]QQS04096.1 MAG: hypothetical protein IPK50_17630 [Fibrobacterota bacterium]